MSKPIDWIKVSTLFSTSATLILVLFTYIQVSRYENSMKADFAHRMKKDFFNESQRNILFLFNNDLLEFKLFTNSDSSVYFPYFSLNKERVKYFQNDSIKLLPNVKDSYTTYEIEDLILNHFEDLNLYRKNGLIDDEYLYNGYTWYVESMYENKQIVKLLEWMNSGSEKNDSYSGFKELYLFIQKYENVKGIHR